MMKKFKYILALVIFAIPALALGQSLVSPGPDLPSGVNWTTDNVLSYVRTALNWFFYILLLMAIIQILMVAWNYVTKAGKPDDAKKSGGSLTWILVGIVVALIAKGLVYMTCYLLTAGATKCIF